MKRYIKSAVTNPANEPVDVRMEMVRSPRTSTSTIDLLVNSTDPNTLTYESYDLEIIREVVHDPRTSPDALRTIYQWHKFLDYVFTEHPNTPDDILLDIVENGRAVRSVEEAIDVLNKRGIGWETKIPKARLQRIRAVIDSKDLLERAHERYFDPKHDEVVRELEQRGIDWEKPL